jgi:hypothetical protein
MRRLLALLPILILGACQYQIQKKPLPTFRGGPRGNVIGYDVVHGAIFKLHCITCHSGPNPPKGVNLTSYEGVVAKIQLVRSEVEAGTMPTSGPLPKSLQDLLALWIDKGMPRDPVPLDPGEGVGGDPGDGDPEPLPELAATYASLKVHVFGKCIGCHAAGGSADEHPMTTREEIIEDDDLLEVDDPTGSGMVLAMRARTFADAVATHSSVARGDDDIRPMPPAGSGIPEVSPVEIDTVVEWIRQGAPE